MLTELRERAARYAAGFDPSRVTVADAEVVLREITAIESTLGVVKAQAAARVAGSDRYRLTGAKSATEHLARRTGSSLGAAKLLVETGKRLEELPVVREAAARGEITPAQAALIAEAAAADPSAGAGLIERAHRLSHGELRSECAAVKAAADPDPEATRARTRAQRSCRRWDDGHGTGHLHLSGPLEDIVLVESTFAPRREALFRQARKDGQRVRSDALDYDALLATIRASARADADANPGIGAGRGHARGQRRWAAAKVIVRVDHTALQRGHPVGGEVCEIAGAGPIAVSAVREILDEGAFLAAVVTKGRKVAGVAHLGRAPTAHQRTALQWTSPTCAREGCNRHARLEWEHRIPWAKTRHTLLEELDRLCAQDHDLKTHQGWSLVEGTGKRALVPPGDPRHPLRRTHGGPAPMAACPRGP